VTENAAKESTEDTSGLKLLVRGFEFL